MSHDLLKIDGVILALLRKTNTRSKILVDRNAAVNIQSQNVDKKFTA